MQDKRTLNPAPDSDEIARVEIRFPGVPQRSGTRVIHPPVSDCIKVSALAAIRITLMYCLETFQGTCQCGECDPCTQGQKDILSAIRELQSFEAGVGIELLSAAAAVEFGSYKHASAVLTELRNQVAVDKGLASAERLRSDFERKYIARGYVYSGCLSRGEMSDAEALQELINAGLVIERTSQAPTYVLSAGERRRLIAQFRLYERWQEQAPAFHPNDEDGEVCSVYQATAACQWSSFLYSKRLFPEFVQRYRCSWTDGGCFILARAIQIWLGADIVCLLREELKDEQCADHFLAAIAGFYLDADGIYTRAELLSHWNQHEQENGRTILEEPANHEWRFVGILKNESYSRCLAEQLREHFGNPQPSTLLSILRTPTIHAV